MSAVGGEPGVKYHNVQCIVCTLLALYFTLDSSNEIVLKYLNTICCINCIHSAQVQKSVTPINIDNNT